MVVILTLSSPTSVSPSRNLGLKYSLWWQLLTLPAQPHWCSGSSNSVISSRLLDGWPLHPSPPIIPQVLMTLLVCLSLNSCFVIIITLSIKCLHFLCHLCLFLSKNKDKPWVWLNLTLHLLQVARAKTQVRGIIGPTFQLTDIIPSNWHSVLPGNPTTPSKQIHLPMPLNDCFAVSPLYSKALHPLPSKYSHTHSYTIATVLISCLNAIKNQLDRHSLRFPYWKDTPLNPASLSLLLFLWMKNLHPFLRPCLLLCSGSHSSLLPHQLISAGHLHLPCISHFSLPLASFPSINKPIPKFTCSPHIPFNPSVILHYSVPTS